ncbi:MAG: MFS transporter [Alphaproteobacteria bacterium]|nr:MFS transporter [Alphaproteobacteria bacterium]
MTDDVKPAKTRKNVALLATGQALANTTQGVMLAIAALVGFQLAENKALATLPHAVQWLGVMAFAVPVSMMMRRIGRRAGFMTGALAGIAAGLIGALAIWWGSFWIYVASMFCFGAFSATAQHYRFAAAEAADLAWRSKAISLVIGGGVVAAFVGPEIAKLSKDWFAPFTFAGTFVALSLVPLLLIFSVAWVDIPRAPEEKRGETGRPMRVIAAQPGFIVAVLAAVIGWGAMVLMMASTPIAMVNHGHHFDDAAFVIQWHIFGMYAPSFVTGWLIARFGVLNILIAGLALTLAAAVNGMLGMDVFNFWIANICVGAGWNFLFVGGTTLLTYTYTPAERSKVQGCNDFLVFGAVAVFSFLSGWIQTGWGWYTVMFTMLPLIGLVFLAVLWLRLNPRAAPEAIRPGHAAAE